ncbi:MAG: substrate-binding periplasmic protein [Parachlamydiaceae bacterium]
MDKQFKHKMANRYAIIGMLLAASLVYLFSSCSLSLPSDLRYIVGQDPRWKDLRLNGKERHLTAFNNELLSLIGKAEDFQASLISTLNVLSDLQKGKIQGGLTTSQPNYSNEGLIFSDPYFLVGPVLIVSPGYDKNPKKENGKNIIGIPANSPVLGRLQEDPSTQIKFYDDILSALSDLKEGKIDGAIFPTIPAHIYTETFYKGEFNIATVPLTDQGIRLVALKNEAGASLIKKFNQGLKNLKENGTYHEILIRWGFAEIE